MSELEKLNSEQGEAILDESEEVVETVAPILTDTDQGEMADVDESEAEDDNRAEEKKSESLVVHPEIREINLFPTGGTLSQILRVGRSLCEEVIRKEKQNTITQIYVMPDAGNVKVGEDYTVFLEDAEQDLQNVWIGWSESATVEQGKRIIKQDPKRISVDTPEKNPFIQKDIRTISEILESCLQKLVPSERPNARAKAILENAILTGQAEMGSGFREVDELRKELLRAEILVTIGEEILHYQDKLMVYAYEYAADQSRFLKYQKSVDGVVYLMEEPGEGKRHSVLFSKDEIVFLELHAGPNLFITNRIKIPYTELIGAYCSVDLRDKKVLQVLSGGEDAKSWSLQNIELGNIGDGVVCHVIDSIVACIRKCGVEDLPLLYANLCETAADIAPEEENLGLIDWWDLVVMLGEKAHSQDESFCFDILMSTYQKKKARAKLDHNENEEKRYRRRILQLVDAEGQTDTRRVDIVTDRQITIPKTYFETIGFASEAQVIMRDGELILRPIIEEDPEVKAERLLESLIEKGLTDHDLLVAFKAGKIPADVDDVDDSKKKSDENAKETKVDEPAQKTSSKSKKSAGVKKTTTETKAEKTEKLQAIAKEKSEKEQKAAEKKREKVADAKKKAEARMQKKTKR